MSGAAAPVSELVVRAERWVRERPGAIACQVGGRAPHAVTYLEMARSVETAAAALARAGVRPGTRTVLLVPPGVELGVLALALLGIGAVPVLADPGMPYREVARCLAVAGPEAFVGVPRAHAARLLLGWGRACRIRVTVGSRLWPGPVVSGPRGGTPYRAGGQDAAPDEPGSVEHTEVTPHTGTGPPMAVPGGGPRAGKPGGRAEPAATGGPREAPGSVRPQARDDARSPATTPAPGGGPRGRAVPGPAGRVGVGLPWAAPAPDDLAVIAYTSGSTGPPKGVPLRHRHLAAQLDLLAPLGIVRAGGRLLSAFVPFALGAVAFGATAVVPDMDPRRPLRADPASLAGDIRRYGVETVFAAPALLDRLARHCLARGLVLDPVRVVAVAGAPLPLPTLRRVRACLPGGARVVSVYGATECLPVAAIDGDDLAATLTGDGTGDAGTCLGEVLPGTLVRVIGVTDGPIPRWRDGLEVPAGTVGEIVVASPAVSDPYLGDPAATALARIADGDRVWHRMGDLGHVDARGRLWFAGRRSERVRTAHGDLCADHVETVFATVPGVRRTALVGVGPPGGQRPVLVVEPEPGARRAEVRDRVLARAAGHPRAAAVRDVLFHRSLPVDARHNSKILRGALAGWAERRLGRRRR